MRPRVFRTKRLIPALCLGVFLLAVPPAVHAQSARFDQFTETTPKAGEMAPEFSLMTLEGQPFDLMEAATERSVVLEFGSFT